MCEYYAYLATIVLASMRHLVSPFLARLLLLYIEQQNNTLTVDKIMFIYL